MSNESIRVIHVDDIPTGGFAGIVETKMVISPKISSVGAEDKKISQGLGDFIYLANGYFKANDGVPIHPHKDVDIVSFITDGSVGHKGSLGDGSIVNGPGVQVQRAGTGMQHSEYSLNNQKAGIIQMWFLPPDTGLEPNYKNFKLSDSGLTTVLGGTDGSFNSNMVCKVGYLPVGEEITVHQPFVVLITQGEGSANGVPVAKGDLIEGDSLQFTAGHDLGLALIHANH